MKRLTKRYKDGRVYVYRSTTVDEVLRMLSKYEDIEEEMGCPLEAIMKSEDEDGKILIARTKEGVWYIKRKGGNVERTSDYGAVWEIEGIEALEENEEEAFEPVVEDDD